MLRVFSYLGLLAVIVILAILAVNELKGFSSVAGEGSLGESKAVKQINSDGEEPIDPKAEMKDTIRGALNP